ncbi:UNVERIFIED_CONTAM: hypothetical protein K2H54_025325 [Gekko kuhli]
MQETLAPLVMPRQRAGVELPQHEGGQHGEQHGGQHGGQQGLGQDGMAQDGGQQQDILERWRATSARCLGITSGASVSCINQIPPSEIVIQPPSATVVIPGPVLAASCEPVRVGGYTACAGCPPCGRIC